MDPGVIIPIVVVAVILGIPGIGAIILYCFVWRQMEKTKLKPADRIAPPVGRFDPCSYPKQQNQPPPLNTVSYPPGGGPGMGYSNAQGTTLEDEGTGL